MEAKASRLFGEEIAQVEELVENEEDSTIHNITIDIGAITGLKPVYPLSDVILTVTFGEDTLFTSEKLTMSERISIEHEIHITVDTQDLEMINKLISMPFIFSLLEYPVPLPQETITETGQGLDSAVNQGKILWRSEESILDLEEALFGSKSKLKPEKGSKKSSQKAGSSKSKSKSSKSSHGSKTSKASKKSKKSKANSKSSVKSQEGPEPVGPQVAGTAMVDMTALFLGDASMVETLVLKAPAGQPLDDRMISASNLPVLHVIILMDRPIPPGNMFYYTVESIYNLPKVMSEQMDYKMILGLPTSSKCKLVPFDTYTYSGSPREPYSFKKYYGTPELSNFALRDDFDDVKWTSMDYEHAWYCDFPRLEFNVIKGERASDEEIDTFKTKVSTYRCIPIEIYVTNPDVMGSTKSKTDNDKEIKKTSKAGSKKSNKNESKKGSKKSSKKESKKDSKKGKNAKNIKSEGGGEKKDEEYLHLMAFVDICRLLYPGEQKTRVACELRTFNMQEFEEMCGLKDSYFRPKPPPPEPPEPSKPKEEKKEKVPKGKKGSTKDKSSKSSKSKKSKDKKSKSSKASKSTKKGQGDLKSKLPIPEPTPPPSEPVYNEQGYPTFIILEFEFRYPLTLRRDLADVHEELEQILEQYPKAPEEPRIFTSKYVSQDLFQNTIKGIFQDLKQQYLQYLSENGKAENILDFMTFLTEGEKYQIYLNTLTKYASMYCNVTKKFNLDFTKDEYHAFVGEIYVDLVELLNTTLGCIGAAGDEFPKEQDGNIDGLLFYAKEATEIDAQGLAQHYYLKRISDHDTSSAYWLDYGIFKLQIDEVDAALECAIEGLKQGPADRDCLLLFALLQARSGSCAEAETCLLNITLTHPRWLEGWMALYCVYLRSKNFEGMEVCQEMAKKYSKEHVHNRFEDLSWCGAKLPDNYIFRSIKYFINMRLIEEAEILLAEELYQRNTDTLEYLLAILSMLKRHYDHALAHIELSFKMGRCSYEKNIVKGHIFMGLNKLDCALVEYEKIIHTTDDIPFDESIYLVYIRAGLCYSALGMHQSARKILLKASEKRGTPYSWLATGVLYYHQHDYLSAEECLKTSNMLDNVMPETWAYLTLVNIKLGRPDEATICYQQAITHNLQNEELLATMDNEIKHWENE